ncbi:MAG TPA: 6-bladed beta-propeller [Longimicrobium sp.]|nr:6-bladed beta-propeller [Longimicrobium sp.]
MIRLNGPSRATALLLGLTLAGCGRDGGAADAVRVDTLAGGTVAVHNSEQGAWTEQTAWRAVEDLRLGRADGSGPDVFAAPVALEADALGRLYVLDAQASQLRVFDADGRHVRSVGGQGAGPGEFRQPMGMAMAPDGALWVVDPGNGRFTVFDTAGALRTTVRRASGLAMMPWPGRFDRQGRLWDVSMGPGGMSGPPSLLRVDPASGNVQPVSLPAFSPPQFSATNGPVSVSAPVPFAPNLVWTLDAEGRVWSGVSDHYRLRLHEPAGDTVRVVERTAPPVEVAASERDSLPAQLKWFTDQGGRIDLSRVPKHKPAFVSILTDDQGWLWVRPALPAAERNAAFDVFDPEGRYQGRISLPVVHMDGMPLIIRGDRIYAAVLSDEGVPQVVRFRIQGRSPATRVAARH